MRLLSFRLPGEALPRLGALHGSAASERILDLASVPVHGAPIGALHGDMVLFLAGGETLMDQARQALALAQRADAPAACVWHRPEDVAFLPVVPRPGKVLCVGLNFPSHIEEARRAGQPLPPEVAEPLGFGKVGSALTGHGQPIVFPRHGRQLDYEVELAFVIGRSCSNVAAADFARYVAGCSIAVDYSLRDLLFRSGGNPFQAKNFDGFCPLGPTLVTLDELGDPDERRLRLWVNDELRQDESMKNALFGCADVLAYWSQRFSFEPGDVITCGTPAGVGIFSADPARWLLQPGDVVRASIDGLGTLVNPIVADPRA